MGTSSGYVPPSSGNWTSLKRHLGMLIDDPAKKEIVLSKFVKALGGARGFSSNARQGGGGNSTKSFKSISAKRTSQNVLGFLSDASVSGLSQTVEERSIDLTNKNIDEIKEVLIDYFTEPSIDADTDASSRAIAAVMDDLFNSITTEEELERYFSEALSKEKIEYFLCTFYEHYIFELFARVFFEDRTKLKSQSDAIEILNIVKETIKSKVTTYQCNADLQNIDFKGKDGEDFVQGVLNDILEIFEDVEDV